MLYFGKKIAAKVQQKIEIYKYFMIFIEKQDMTD